MLNTFVFPALNLEIKNYETWYGKLQVVLVLIKNFAENTRRNFHAGTSYQSSLVPWITHSAI